jgi:hypothetical protein
MLTTFIRNTTYDNKAVALAKELVEMHHGQFTVDSKEKALHSPVSYHWAKSM